MATTRSSRAITSTRARRLAVSVGAMVLAAGMLAAATLGGSAIAPARPPAAVAATTQAAVEQGGPSFFDPFDRLDTGRWMVSDGWLNGDHQGCTWSRDNVSISRGVLQMTLGKAKDKSRPYRCAEIKTNGHLGYGTYEARMRTAAGSGMNTALFTYIGGGHDEVDFEFLGKDPTSVQLNWFKNGVGGHETFPKLGFDASAGFNDYAFVWEPNRTRWYINGKLVREAKGTDLPTRPGSMFLTLWNGTTVVDGWLGPMDASRTPVAADVDWAGFTRAGERCRFPQSVTCTLP